MSAPACTCDYSGAIGEGLHVADCKRWVAIVTSYRPSGLRVERGKVVREP